MKPKSRSLLLAALMTLLALGLAQSGKAQTPPPQCWSSAATSTVINTSDLNAANQNGPTLTINGSATVPVGLSGRLSISGIFQDIGAFPQAKLLAARYRDNGSESRIVLELRQVNVATGAAATLATFDSDAFAPSSVFQTNQVATGCALNGGFDFINNMYFLNVQVDKTGSNGNPGLWIIRVCTTPC
jgi:hypothetical protein